MRYIDDAKGCVNSNPRNVCVRNCGVVCVFTGLLIEYNYAFRLHQIKKFFLVAGKTCVYIISSILMKVPRS